MVYSGRARRIPPAPPASGTPNRRVRRRVLRREPPWRRVAWCGR